MHLNFISERYEKWRVKINQNKSLHTMFTLKKGVCSNIVLNNAPDPTSDTVRFLRLKLNLV